MPKTTLDFQIDDAAEILEAHGIVLFVINTRDSASDMWTELAAEHGDMIAVAQPMGDELIVSWHYDHKPVAWRIREAFRNVGLRATWEGEIWHAVHVDLTPRRPAHV
jgi:hypothetical protein